MVHTLIRSFKYAGGVLAVSAAWAGMAYAGGSSSGGGVPELDPSSLLSALTLVIGGVLMIYDTNRRMA